MLEKENYKLNLVIHFLMNQTVAVGVAHHLNLEKTELNDIRVQSFQKASYILSGTG